MAPITANLAKLGPEAKLPVLKVAFSATTIFRGGWDKNKETLEAWRKRQIEEADHPMSPGPAFPFFRKLVMLNHYNSEKSGPPLVKVDVVSKQDPAVTPRFLNSLHHYGLLMQMERFKSQCFYTAGGSVSEILMTLGAHLFLSSNLENVKKTLQAGIPSAYMDPESEFNPEEYTDTRLKVALDGDSVCFDEQTDVVYNKAGLDPVHQLELQFQKVPLQPGPLHPFLIALAAVRSVFPLNAEESPLHLMLATARGLTGQLRVSRSVQEWGVHIDESFFLNGGEKGEHLQKARATIFFDDTDRHIVSARAHKVPAALVPHEKREGM